MKPAEADEKRQGVPPDFYDLLGKNKKAFDAATSAEIDDVIAKHRGGANDAYILKRLKAREIRRYQGYTEDDELYIQQVIQLLTDGALPRPTTKKLAEALRQPGPRRLTTVTRVPRRPQIIPALRIMP